MSYPFFYSDFDRLFDEAFATRSGNCSPQACAAVQRQNRTGSGLVQPLKPRMDLHEDTKNNAVTATFELPGLSKENVQIDVYNSRLNVSGETKISSEHEESGYAVRERKYGKFFRTLQLPQGVKEDQIQASLENGVLTVTFPKTTPETAPKTITIA